MMTRDERGCLQKQKSAERATERETGRDGNRAAPNRRTSRDHSGSFATASPNNAEREIPSANVQATSITVKRLSETWTTVEAPRPSIKAIAVTKSRTPVVGVGLYVDVPAMPTKVVVVIVMEMVRTVAIARRRFACSSSKSNSSRQRTSDQKFLKHRVLLFLKNFVMKSHVLVCGL